MTPSISTLSRWTRHLALCALAGGIALDARAARAGVDDERRPAVAADSTLKNALRRAWSEVRAGDHELRLGGAGRIGGQVGHVLQVPEAFVFPGAGLQLRYKLHFLERFFTGVEAAANVGVGEDGEPLGGYRAMAFVGMKWLKLRFVSLALELHAGPSSYSLLPVPRYGVGHTITLTPLALGWMTWDLNAQLNSDLLLIVPVVSTGVSTALTFMLWKVLCGVELGASAEALIAGVANSASAALTGKAFVGLLL